MEDKLLAIAPNPEKVIEKAGRTCYGSDLKIKTGSEKDFMQEAHARGLRTYGMLCPLLPGIANLPEQIEELVRFAVEYGAEEIFVEPVNLRGRGLELTQQALASSGYKDEAVAVESIRTNKGWSRYATQLVTNVQQSVRKLYDISRLRFLLYPSRLKQEDAAQIKRDDAGVVWL